MFPQDSCAHAPSPPVSGPEKRRFGTSSQRAHNNLVAEHSWKWCRLHDQYHVFAVRDLILLFGGGRKAHVLQHGNVRGVIVYFRYSRNDDVDHKQRLAKLFEIGN